MSRAGEGDADELVVVGKYTQTRQMWLKEKIIKSSHGRHYKKTFTMPKKKGSKNRGITQKKNRIERK